MISDVKSGIPIWVAERTKMMNKRMSKLAGLEASTDPPVLEGPAEADVTFVAWGSTVAAVRDALRILAERGVTANLLFVRTLFPLHGKAVVHELSQARHPVLVEANFSGQLGRLIRAETGVEIPDRLLKYDGEPFYPHEIVQKGLEVIGHGRK